MRIPFSQLRFTEKEINVWGINFKREIARKNEDDFLVFIPKNESGFVSHFAQLDGINDIYPANSFEILPYITTKAEYTKQNSGNPFNDRSRYSSHEL